MGNSLKCPHQRPPNHLLIRQRLAEKPAITLRRRQLLFGLFVFSSLMAVMILTGFAYMFHNSSAFIGHENMLRALDGNRERNWKTRPAVSIPKHLHFFSDQEAYSNTEKFDRLREWYNSRCSCERIGCQFVDENFILPEVRGAILHAIQSNETRTRLHVDDDDTRANQKNTGDSMNLETELIQLLEDDGFWNRPNIPKCPNVIMDLGSNRGDTLQSYLNVLLSSVYSPSSLSPFDTPGHECINNTEQESYQFDLQSLSTKPRTAAESSKRHDRVHNHHQLDMESYLDLHIGRVDGEGDPWMDFQLKERMEQTQKRHGEEQSKLFEMKKIYEEHMRKNGSLKLNRPRPEDYCFYGVEGNPSFTRKLRGLELMIMGGSSQSGEHSLFQEASNIRPPLSTATKGLRALRHIHFFTETVVTSESGPTELYLDSMSADHVGSSLLKSHKYALMGGKETVEVQGVTLTWLLQHVLSGFGAETGREGGGHLILKIDIEGGEYSVLKEALESGLLCDYANKRGNRVDLAVEFHKWVIEDKKQKEGFAKLERMFYEELSSCGVHLTKMDINWH